MRKILYYDATSGISGDMNLGALLGLGLDFEKFCTELNKLGLENEFEIRKSEVVKQGIFATKIDIKPVNLHTHARNFTQICKLINSSNLTEFVKNKAIAIFTTLGVAEAKIHGCDLEEVHFHEVGAIDSIVDIVGACICFEMLENPQIISSTVELGGGMITCTHGKMSVPAPAVSEILSGVSVSLGRADFEMTTPTGAAILKTCADSFAKRANFKIIAQAYGAGNKNAPNFANALRVMLCESENLAQTQTIICTNIDDMDAESFAYACEILFENGALDVFSTPIYMKKGRIGFELSVLCKNEEADKFRELIFANTSAIGVREYEIKKTELKRKFVKVVTKFGEISVKISGDGKNLTVKPEFSECMAFANKFGVTLATVRSEAIKAYENAKFKE